MGDVNGDGKPDLAVADQGSNAVSVLLGNGDGTFQAQKTFATGSAPRSVSLGDVNGDGNLDLVVANEGSNSVSVLLGNGNGSFQGQRTFAAGAAPTAVALGDVTGDAKLDLVVANLATNNVSVLLGNGDGTFQAQSGFAAGSQPFAVALGDGNGDGKLDLVVANESSGTASVLLGNVVGNFTGQAYTILDAAATHLIVSGTPASAVAGANVTFTVTALDGLNNIANGYTGTVSFSSTDSGAKLPASATLTGGVGTFNATLATVGSQILIATDLATSSITSGSSSITVTPGAASHFVLSAPGAATAGTAFVFQVTALDQFNNTATGYAGTVHFTSTDTQAVVSSPTSILTARHRLLRRNAENRRHANAPGHRHRGKQHHREQSSDRGQCGQRHALCRHHPAAAHVSGRGRRLRAAQVPAPASSFFTTGSPVVFTVAAEDSYGNVQPNYAGTVAFSSSDPGAVLPANSTLPSGVGVFSATLQTPGNQFITATDVSSAAITGA